MQLSEVLERVSKNYVLGAVEFYAKANPNPWQRAHDELEGQLLLHRDSPKYFDLMQPAYQKFLKETKRLLDAYRAFSGATRIEPSISDCFMISDQDKVKRLYALASNACVQCGTKENVRAIQHPAKGNSIFCTKCVK